ncbi:hypothetical protein ACFWDG_14695 [Peribacillus sp. NPDC060186]
MAKKVLPSLTCPVRWFIIFTFARLTSSKAATCLAASSASKETIF